MPRGHITPTHNRASYPDPEHCEICRHGGYIGMLRVASQERRDVRQRLKSEADRRLAEQNAISRIASQQLRAYRMQRWRRKSLRARYVSGAGLTVGLIFGLMCVLVPLGDLLGWYFGGGFAHGGDQLGTSVASFTSIGLGLLISAAILRRRYWGPPDTGTSRGSSDDTSSVSDRRATSAEGMDLS